MSHATQVTNVLEGPPASAQGQQHHQVTQEGGPMSYTTQVTDVLDGAPVSTVHQPRGSTTTR